MKYSKQRELIHQALLANKSHPTADVIYQAVRKQNPNISLGTVYRNLNRLVSGNAIGRVHVPEGGDRFDYRTDQHYHVLCDKCGKLQDVDAQIFTDFTTKIQADTDFIITGHNLLLTGICHDCQQKEHSQPEPL